MDVRARACTAALALALSVVGPLLGDGADLWTDVPATETAAALTTGERWIAPERARIVRLDRGALRALLATAPDEGLHPRGVPGAELTIPRPDGGELRLRVVDSPIMEPELAARYPEIRTFRLIDVERPGYGGRGDSTPHGFHAVVRTPEGMLYVDPLRAGDDELHQAYFRQDLRRRGEAFRCLAGDRYDEKEGESLADAGLPIPSGVAGLDLRTYRLALAATGEYTQFFGGTVGNALAGITTAVNRVNEIYERELAIRMILVANNNQLIFTNGATDPYTNDDGFAMLDQNQTVVNSTIGSANYDIGHVFSTGGGGVASFEVPCFSAGKARGVTGLPTPVGDPFYVDFVAHEIGHQWGGDHTFNGTAGNCGTRVADSAYEPGSGSTIMAYAGICSPQNLQPNSDPYFHRRSLDQIVAYSRNGDGDSCASTVADGNQAPVAEAGDPYTIPKSTPFALTGSGSDADAGDVLSYAWEQFDLGDAGAPNSPVGDAPIFRSFNPSASSTRTFPRLEDLVNGTQTIGELLPTYTRTLNFRLTVRDNHAPAGAEAFDSTTVTVDGASGPFLVTAPNTAVVWAGTGPHTVTWNVAGTTAAPVSCAQVDVHLSTDGGFTFAQTLATAAANDGSHDVFVAGADTTSARIQVACSGNIFFDISNADFTISGSGTGSDEIFVDGFETAGTGEWSDVQPTI